MKRFALADTPLDESAARDCVSRPDAGGIVTFVGRVRDHARGREVVALEYEAYPEMVERVFADIAREAQMKFDIVEVAIHHRTGKLHVGDTAVIIAVSARHRGAAFDACEYIIDELKTRAPIWKKEYSADGALWVDDRP